VSGCAVGVLFVLASAVATVASADPATDRAALTQFEAAYQATAKLSGAARTNQACLDAAKLDTAGSAFSSDTAPADAPVDDAAWASAAGGLAGSLEKLAEVCKTPDRKLRLLGPNFKTADQVVQELDNHVSFVLNSARPRTLSPAMKTAQAAISAMLASSKSICSQLPKLAKALGQCPKPPTGVAAAAWKEPYQTVKNIADDLKPAACGRHRAADEQIGSALSDLHDNFYKLVLLVPPR
jgi:hypothetical protein